MSLVVNNINLSNNKKINYEYTTSSDTSKYFKKESFYFLTGFKVKMQIGY